jgi:hypothetical protein
MSAPLLSQQTRRVTGLCLVLEDLRSHRLHLALFVLLVVSCVACWSCSPAHALILAPQTVDGPSSAIGEFGGAAVSSDGTAGVVYTKQVEGVQHVFAAQYSNGIWHAPVRVDWQDSYAATYPRIAAAGGGQLVVVWVSQIATVGGRPRDALYSSTLGPGAATFGHQYTVDPNVSEGAGVNPSLALAANGQGYLAYRVITNNFSNIGGETTIERLRPGDVLADIRLARYEAGLWSAPVRVNHDPKLSMRPPSETNGPQVALGNGDDAVVAWQEPEPSGVARIWARRIFGTTLGLAQQVSPTTYGGAPVTGDADAFSLSVSEFGEAKVVSRVTGTPGALLSSARLFDNTLPVSSYPKGAEFTGAQPVEAAVPSSASIGTPSVAVDDSGGFRIAFSAGSSADVLIGSERGTNPEVPLGPSVSATGAGAVTAIDPAGGGITAWPARSTAGLPGVAIRQDFPDGAAQSAVVSGSVDGSVSQLAVAGSESGEALVGFREGESGAFEIVGERVSVPPPEFSLETPVGWVAPAAARVAWAEAEDATGGVRYSLILNGRVVQRGIHGLAVLPPRRLLGSGVQHVQVLATDAAGQQTLSGEAELKVAATPPVAHVRRTHGHGVIVRVTDAYSRAVAKDTRIAFGDGAHLDGRLIARHRYAQAGLYTIVVRMADAVGNRGVARLRVKIR